MTMTPDEILAAEEAIGSRSSRETAERLGLPNPATGGRVQVDRWKLPADHKEARRPAPYLALAFAALVAGLPPFER